MSELLEKTEQAGPPQYIGQFRSAQAKYGVVEVLAHVQRNSLVPIENASKLFPQSGCVELVGLLAMHLKAGDLVSFRAVRNNRPGMHKFKADKLVRIRRFAEVPVATLNEARYLLTCRGWKASAVGGAWALKLATGQLLLVELGADGDDGLKIPPEQRSAVRIAAFDAVRACVPKDGSNLPSVYFPDEKAAVETCDWSDDVDHVGRVVRSLADWNDRHVQQVLAWLKKHQDEAGRLSVAGADPAVATAALRSGELADRLKEDREVMAAYLEAAVRDDAVREAVLQAAREGMTQEREVLRAELAEELMVERNQAFADLEKQIAEHRKKALSEAVAAAEVAAANRSAELQSLHDAREAELRSRMEAAEREAEVRLLAIKAEIEIAEGTLAGLTEKQADSERTLGEASEQLAGLRAEIAAAEQELDRLLEASKAIKGKNAPSSRLQGSLPQLVWPSRPLVAPRAVEAEIEKCPLLSASGRALMKDFLALVLAGEVPVLEGSDVDDFVLLAERLICPGRSVQIEADPALISFEDLWARPGSGMPTVLAQAAAAAAESQGAALAVIRGIERSAARFWYPALVRAAREGTVPRQLLLCATVADPKHEELANLPADRCQLLLEGALDPNDLCIAPLLLRAAPDDPILDVTTGDGEIVPFVDMQSRAVSVSHAVRKARVHAGALQLTEDKAVAASLARRFAESIQSK